MDEAYAISLITIGLVYLLINMYFLSADFDRKQAKQTHEIFVYIGLGALLIGINNRN
jgi:hypothetical protein